MKSITNLSVLAIVGLALASCAASKSSSVADSILADVHPTNPRFSNSPSPSDLEWFRAGKGLSTDAFLETYGFGSASKQSGGQTQWIYPWGKAIVANGTVVDVIAK